MRTRQSKVAEKGHALAQLRTTDDGPDPRFRAALRERLMTAAGDYSEDRGKHGQGDGRPDAID